MPKIVRWTVLAVGAYGLWRFVQSQSEREGGVAAALDRARERVESAIAEGQRVAAATREQLEAQAGRALREHDDEGDEDDELSAAPWPPPAPAGPGHPV